MLHDSVDAIQRYDEAVRAREVKPTCNHCPRCGEKPPEFRLRGHRKRTFLVLVGRAVKRVLSLLSRWKCPLCGQSFTLYPPFAVPRKRYVRETIFELSERYATRDELSYRRAVERRDMPVFYDQKADGTIDERALSHSTLHRWLPFFSTLAVTLSAALRLCRARSPTTDIFRRVFPVAPKKYRSDERRKILALALEVISTDREYRALFSRSIFPELATASAWS